MTAIRINHMVEQYIWSLENDGVFVPKAKHEIERGNFNAFRDLCGEYIKPIRRQLGENTVGAIAGTEWAYLYLETWVRLGGFNILMSNLYYDKDVMFQLKRLESAGLGVARAGVIKLDRIQNPCAEIYLSKPQPCVLAEPEKEISMSNKIIIKNVTFINNVDVTSMNDDQLIDAIKTIESEIADLKSVKTKSAKIAAKILEAQGTLSTIVELLDGR